MKIFQKLFLLLGLSAALPLGVVAITVLWRSGALKSELITRTSESGEETARHSRDSHYHQAKKIHLEVVRTKTAHLQDFFDTIRQAVTLEVSLIDQYLASPSFKGAPPLYSAVWVADKKEDPDSDFLKNKLGKTSYVMYDLAPKVAEGSVSDDLQRLRRLGSFFAHIQREVPWSKTSYMGHSSGFILGYPGGGRFPESFDPRKRPWYTLAAEKKTTVWTGLYADKDGETVITCAAPVIKGAKTVAVAALDVQLTKILDQLFDLGRLSVSEAVLVGGDGKVRIGSAYEAGEAKTVMESTPIEEYREGILSEAYKEAKKKDSPGILAPPDPHAAMGGSLIAYAPVRMGGETWIYLFRTPITPILLPALAVEGKLSEANRNLVRLVDKEIVKTALQMGAVIFLALIAVFSVAFLSAKGATGPLSRMAEAARRIGKGDLDQDIALDTPDEIGDLSRAIDEMVKGLKEGLFVKSTFKRYVSAAVVEEILKAPDKVKLGGERRELTVFFSDVSGFTSLSEHLSPEDLVDLINEYLEAMTDSILEEHGTLDKYEGDAVMAFWGAPLEQSDHAVRACRAALDNLAKLRALRPIWRSRGLPPLDMRIGLNTGTMVVGNMGSTVRMDYTVMGDSVNIGARLEEASKIYGTHIIISESTREQAGEAIVVRELDRLKVRGRTEPLVIYELLGLKDHVEGRRLDAAEAFEGALALYRKRDWDGAEKAFKEAKKLFEGDKASEVFMERIAVFRESPPEDDWGGVFEMRSL